MGWRWLSWFPWLGLLAFVALPVPVALKWTAGIDPTVSWPLIWVLAAAIGTLGVGAWRGNPALAGGWILLVGRVWWMGFPARSLEVLALTACGVLLYAAALRLPRESERWAALLILVGAGVNAGLGLWNLTAQLTPHWRSLVMVDAFGTALTKAPLIYRHPAYPGLRIDETFFGLPFGLFTHPNFLALFLALAIPLVPVVIRPRWGRWVAWGAGAGVILAAGTRSAAAAVAGMALCSLSPARRRVALAVTSAAVAGWVVLRGVHPFALGGRLPVWWVAWDWLWARDPVGGIGWGLWRTWALWPAGPVWAGSPRHGLVAQHEMAGWWTEAQGEPMQLLFEVGVVGLLVAAGAATWTGWQAWRVWHDRSDPDPWGRAWVLILVGAAVAVWMSPLLRIPQTAAVVIWAGARVAARMTTRGSLAPPSVCSSPAGNVGSF